jgi:hypothetical protein
MTLLERACGEAGLARIGGEHIGVSTAIGNYSGSVRKIKSSINLINGMSFCD